jgi:hypothetical protein
MRLSGLMLLVTLCFGVGVGAGAQDAKKDMYLDVAASVAASASQLKALQGRTDPVVKKALAQALAAEIPPPPLLQSVPAFSSAKADVMTAAFIEAKVPDCLHSDGLKRQPTFFLAGYLALPFIPIAALRGKCN